MDALTHLRAITSGAEALRSRPLTACDEIDVVLSQLESAAKSAGSPPVPLDLQQQAVQRFWQSLRIDSLREGRLLSFGMCLPTTPGGPCVLEDGRRFSALLDGVDRWMNEPRRFRRCYQGLVANYFSYDAQGPGVPASGRENWTRLRRFLEDRSKNIADTGINPDWVECTLEHKQVFGDAPCARYAPAMLRGETEAINSLRASLGIDDSSWFVRELVLAQIAVATEESDGVFEQHLPQLLTILAPNHILRDRGLGLLLDRHAKVVQTPLQPLLRDAAVAWWGNPWLRSNSMRWGGVSPHARAMVTEWLKLEFIEAFFTLLAEEGIGDRRRLEFWKRYVNAIDQIHFALGADALRASSRDFVELRKKMTGLTVELRDAVSSNNAFVMTMGNLVVVEFSGRANALYGYDAGPGLPFDLTSAVSTTVNASNSLKHRSRQLWLKHQDGIRGWDSWEQMFEETLARKCGIQPKARVGSSRSVQVPRTPARVSTAARPLASASGAETRRAPASATSLHFRYSRENLDKFALALGLDVVDRTGQGGALWVRSVTWDERIEHVLRPWGFKFKVGKGWWK